MPMPKSLLLKTSLWLFLIVSSCFADQRPIHPEDAAVSFFSITAVLARSHQKFDVLKYNHEKALFEMYQWDSQKNSLSFHKKTQEDQREIKRNYFSALREFKKHRDAKLDYEKTYKNQRNDFDEVAYYWAKWYQREGRLAPLYNGRALNESQQASIESLLLAFPAFYQAKQAFDESVSQLEAKMTRYSESSDPNDREVYMEAYYEYARQQTLYAPLKEQIDEKVDALLNALYSGSSAKVP